MLTNGFSGWTICLNVRILFMSADVDEGVISVYITGAVDRRRGKDLCLRG